MLHILDLYLPIFQTKKIKTAVFQETNKMIQVLRNHACIQAHLLTISLLFAGLLLCILNTTCLRLL